MGRERGGEGKARRRGGQRHSEKLKWMIVRQRTNKNWRQRERGEEEERDDT